MECDIQNYRAIEYQSSVKSTTDVENAPVLVIHNFEGFVENNFIGSPLFIHLLPFSMVI